MPDVLILAAGQAAIPAGYTVPNAQELTPLLVSGSFDGSSASGQWVPTLEIVSDGGVVVARVPILETFNVGDSCYATFAPSLSGTASPESGYATAAIATGAAGNTQIVPSSGSKRVRVKRVSLMASGNVSVKFTDAHGDLTGLYPLVASTGFVMGPDDDEWWFQSTAGDPLNINLSAGVTVGGVVGWEYV